MLVTIGADTGGGQAAAYAQAPAAAARAGDVREPRRRRVGEDGGHDAVGVGEGVDEARQPCAGEQRPERVVEAGGELVPTVRARPRRAEHPCNRQATG